MPQNGTIMKKEKTKGKKRKNLLARRKTQGEGSRFDDSTPKRVGWGGVVNKKLPLGGGG